MRSHPTHRVTVSSRVKTGENELGSPTYDERPVLDCRGRFDSDGTEFVIAASGERVQAAPTLVLPTTGEDPNTGTQVDVLDTIAEGDTVVLTGKSGEYQISSVEPQRGRGNRIENVKLTLENQV